MTIEFTVNKIQRSVDVPPTMRLIDILRKQEGLVSAKHACTDGSCGRCIALIDNEAVRACLVPALALRDREVVTYEALAETPEYHVILEAFATANFVPCDICRGSRIVNAYVLLNKHATPVAEAVRSWMKETECQRCDSAAASRAMNIAITKYRAMRHDRF